MRELHVTNHCQWLHTSLATDVSAVGIVGTTHDVAHKNDPMWNIDVIKNTPRTHSTTKRVRLILEPLHVAAKRIGAHFFERDENIFAIAPSDRLKLFSCASRDVEFPVH